MKAYLSLWMALMLSVCLMAPLAAQPAPPPEEEEVEDVEDWDAPPPVPMRPGREQMREQYRRQMQQRQMQQRGGQVMGPGMGQGWGGREGRSQVEPEELLAFLQEHEPKMAEKLDALRQEDPRAFMRQVREVGRLYQPVMRQMQYDPTMGQISLKRIRTQLQTEDVLQEYRQATTDADKAALRKKLEGILANQFNVIIEQQELFIQRGKERAEEVQQGDDENEDEAQVEMDNNRGRRGGRSVGGESYGARVRGRDGGGMNRESGIDWGRRPGGGRNFQGRLDEQEKAIAYWKANRDVIVKERLGALLDDKRPFPW